MFFPRRNAITSIIGTQTIVLLVYWAHVIDAHVKMLIRVRCKATAASLVIADQATAAIDVMVGSFDLQIFLFKFSIYICSNTKKHFISFAPHKL